MFLIQMLVILCHNQSDGVIMHDKLKLRGVSCCFFLKNSPTLQDISLPEKKIPLSKNKSKRWQSLVLHLGDLHSLIIFRLSKKRRSPSRMEAMSSQCMPALSCELQSEENHFQKRKIDCAACRVITGCVIEGCIVFYLKRPILKYLLSLCIPGFKPLPILYVLLYYYTVPSACTVPCRPDSYFRLQATLYAGLFAVDGCTLQFYSEV